MQLAKVTACGRFVVVEGLYLDRDVFEALDRWASERRVRVQDAIQLAICAFNQGSTGEPALPGVPSERERERRV